MRALFDSIINFPPCDLLYFVAF